MKKWTIWGALLWILAISVVAGQTTSCPANVLLALSRAGSTCFNVGLSEACFGNGTAQANFFEADTDLRFSAPGDIVSIASIESLTTAYNEDNFSVASLFVQANLADSEQRNTALLMFGEANITNQIPPIVTFIVTANGTINIREVPDITGEIVDSLTLGETLIVNGRVEDSTWLRVRVPNTNDLGWIPAEVASDADPVVNLEVVTDESPFYRPFQLMNVSTGYDDALCDGTPESGILIQAPNIMSHVELIVNGAEVDLSATVFIQNQSDDQLAFYVLDGEMEITVGENTRFVPAGSMIVLPINSAGNITDTSNFAQPYTETAVSALPINNLPDRMVITAGLSQEALDLLVEEWATVVPEQDIEDNIVRTEVCFYTVNQRANLWGGPGIFYEAVNEITAGVRVVPVLETTDADDEVWWQLDNSNWIRASVVDISGNCEPIPFVDNVPPPRTNTLSMETCMSINGPIRAGQIVTIEFIPAPWDGYEEALAATSVDPGRITVNERALNVSASRPILRSGTDNRYFRIFSATWLAEPGTFRIVSRRTSYILTCNITVPFD